MSRDFWYLFSREIKLSGVILGICLLIGILLNSWMVVAYGVLGSIMFLYFQFRNRLQDTYSLFLLLSEELVYRNRLNLTEEEGEIFLYTPLDFLIKWYCVGQEMEQDKRYPKHFKWEFQPELFRKLAGMNAEVFREIAGGVVGSFELLLPLFIGLFFIAFTGTDIYIVLTVVGFIYCMPIFCIRGDSFSDISGTFWEIDTYVAQTVVRPSFRSGNKEWTPYFEKWKRSIKMYILMIPFQFDLESLNECMKERIDDKKFGELTLAYQNKELTAKQIYDQIDEKIEAANLTAQELWDLWAEYYFEGYEAKE